MNTEVFDINLEDDRKIYLQKHKLESIKRDLNEFLEDKECFNTLAFAKHAMLSQEIKYNNTIEGINDDLSLIYQVIKKRKNIASEERKRIINLFETYRYILTNKDIDKEHLRELYSILSRELLKEEDKEKMGDYYRIKPVYITHGCNLSREPYEGMKAEKLDEYMNRYFDFMNSNILNDTDIDKFIKSQVMHFYFVYIHPYIDFNGRIGRTTSMWYLLNNEVYPYIIFNRAIAYNKRKYEYNIIGCRNSANITYFIKYLLDNVLKELEKEYVIRNIQENSKEKINNKESQILEYFLSMNGNLTIKDLAQNYNRYNGNKNTYIVYKEKIEPLLDKNILIRTDKTSRFINNEISNYYIKLNNDNIDIDKDKIKKLEINRYL